MFIFLNSVAVEQEEVVTKRQYYVDGREYYQVFLANHAVLKKFYDWKQYELLTPFAAYGLHNLACVTTSQVCMPRLICAPIPNFHL